MAGRVLIIGAGSVGGVVAHKCASLPDIFPDIMVASRTIGKIEHLQQDIKQTWDRDIEIAQVNADNTQEVVDIINQFKPDVLINVALPYQDLTIMDACLETGVHYIDTANYEPPEKAHFEYSWQWAYRERYEDRGIMAVLGCGFDPGTSNAYAAYVQKHILSEINSLDILDCNAGEHHKAFATNFNPEINIREVTQVARHWDSGEWIDTPPIIEKDSVHFTYDYPEVGPKESYILYHEELESLVQNIRGLKRARFWMTFGENYLTHLRVLIDVGMTRIDPVLYEGHEVIPIRFLGSLLPDPASLALNYQGLTVIGDLCTGPDVETGDERTIFIYNICDHQKCYQEVHANGVAYTAGVPPVVAAAMIIEGKWQGSGVFNVEQLDPDPFLEMENQVGLPWSVIDAEPLPL